MKHNYTTAAILAVGAAGDVFWPSSDPTVQSGSIASSGNTALAKVFLPDTFSENAQVG